MVLASNEIEIGWPPGCKSEAATAVMMGRTYLNKSPNVAAKFDGMEPLIV